MGMCRVQNPSFAASVAKFPNFWEALVTFKSIFQGICNEDHELEYRMDEQLVFRE